MGKRILLVDDEAEIRNVFSTALKSGGYEIVEASGGKQALDLLQTEKFDLILLDQMMTDMSGNDTLRAIKASPVTQDIHVSMLTNFNDESMIKEALDLGAGEYILKYQVSADDLKNKVDSILGE